MTNTKMPDQWWLYSDQAMSSALRGGSSPAPSTKAARGSWARARGLLVELAPAAPGCASLSWSGEARRGHLRREVARHDFVPRSPGPA